METNGKPMKNIDVAFAFDYLEDVNYALVLSKMDICNWCIIENNSDADMENIQLEISGEYVETYLSMPFRLDANQRIRIQDIKLQVNTDKLLSLTEKVASNLVLKIKVAEELVKEQSFPISFMAYNQWHGTDCYPQLLASFITPNHPCIASVVKRASEHLKRLYGTSDFTGYMCENSNDVRNQIEAIYLSLQEEKLSYTLVMPSYEERGQRIRFANEVMASKLGNCMDLTLLFAACLEYIGINTLLILERGHIYLGAWLIPDSHLRSVDDDISFLLKNAAEGVMNIMVVESTTFAKAEEVPFEESVDLAFNSLYAKENFLMFMDVYRCRLEGFRPLPQIVRQDDKWVLAEEDENPYRGNGIPPMGEQTLDKQDMTKPTKQLLWERKLLDFTMRNTLLNVRMASAIQMMSVNLKDIAAKMLEQNKGFRIDEAPSGLELETSGETVFDSAQLDMNMVNLVKDDIKSARLHSYLDDNDTSDTLKKLRRTARTMMEENGANSLFMSFGLMQWTNESGVSLFAPILLLPVELVYKNQVYHVKWRGEEAMLNVTLFEYLKQTFELEFDGLEDAFGGEGNIDLQQIFSRRNGKVIIFHFLLLLVKQYNAFYHYLKGRFF